MSADVPGSGGVAHRTPLDLYGGQLGVFAFTAALVALWLAVDPRTPDLAAQVYRVGLYRQLGFSVWDEHWYAGHQLPGYSLLFPPLAALVGLHTLGALSVLASSVLFAALAHRAYGERARWGAALFAVAALGDVWSGRVTFAFGVPLALAAVLALVHERWLWAGVLAALCAAASPVAGALLGLAGLSLSLARVSPRALLVLALPAAVVVLSLVALFPEGGYEPYPLLSFLATTVALLAFLWALPADAPMLRTGACVYALACLGCLAVRSPIGSNVERYGVLLAGPLLLCARTAGASVAGMRPPATPSAFTVQFAAVRRRWVSRAPRGRLARGLVKSGRALVNAGRTTPGLAVALFAISMWVVWGPIRETVAVTGSRATNASYYTPVERFITRVSAAPAEPVRVEVPLTRSHWEAALLAPSVSLARGWEKQLETRYDGVLLRRGLTAASYERWLHEQAVAYVALPDVTLDPSSAQEGRLIRAGLPYLREVFASAHWRIFHVLAATPILSGPGRLTALGHDSFTLYARTPGRFLVRVHYTRYFTLARGDGCVSPARHGWTYVNLTSPGAALVAARFSLSRAFAGGNSCARGEAYRLSLTRDPHI